MSILASSCCGAFNQCSDQKRMPSALQGLESCPSPPSLPTKSYWNCTSQHDLSLHFYYTWNCLNSCFKIPHFDVFIMAVISSTTLISLFGIVALYVINRLRSKNNERPLPPGPKGIPFVGNVNDMPKPGILECHHWLKHKDLYGACAVN